MRTSPDLYRRSAAFNAQVATSIAQQRQGGKHERDAREAQDLRVARLEATVQQARRTARQRTAPCDAPCTVPCDARRRAPPPTSARAACGSSRRGRRERAQLQEARQLLARERAECERLTQLMAGLEAALEESTAREGAALARLARLEDEQAATPCTVGRNPVHSRARPVD